MGIVRNISSIFKDKQRQPKYNSPYDVPQALHCDNCAYKGKDECNGVRCFTGILKQIQEDRQ